ncbi:hypothetical protein TRAPUB_8205 [Trametes pubescens]|uniref:AC transposase n=1 Tax=Trametes pubescens TaxID=154538 RepID=A0A1M2W5V4_TRAPU|nr:hypothetical protein TRAPUB_8205 [Trametes pubescens]
MSTPASLTTLPKARRSQRSLTASPIPLRGLPSHIHVCVDGWTSPNVLAFLGITVHWHWEGKIHHVILDFMRLTSAHTGTYLAEKLVECLKNFNIHEKVFAVTCDNAESNTVMLREMERLLPGFRGLKTRVRCFGHVNLVVKAILSQFDCKKRAKDDDNDHEEAAKAECKMENLLDEGEMENLLDEGEMENLLDEGDLDEEDEEAVHESDEVCEEADNNIIDSLDDEHLQLILTRAEISAGQLALEKVLKLARKVWNSPTVCAELAGLTAADPDINSEVLIWPVKTRWNTVTEVLAHALEMCDVLTELCDKTQFNCHDGVHLRRFMLDDNEWELLYELHRLLGPFLFTTTQISTSSRALVHKVIPYIDILTEHLDDFADDNTLVSTVRAAAEWGRVVLNKYYEKTDELIVYRIAIILHPAYKTQYFRLHKWTEEWIDEAKDLIKEEWETYYKPANAPIAPVTVPSTGSSSKKAKNTVKTSAAASGKQKGKAMGNSARRSTQASVDVTSKAMFALISANTNKTKDALTAYLKAPPLLTVSDPLIYWDLVLKSAEDPKSADCALARMAVDFLSIPVVGSWAGIPAILHEDDLANVIKAGPAAAARKQATNGAAARALEVGKVIELD